MQPAGSVCVQLKSEDVADNASRTESLNVRRRRERREVADVAEGREGAREIASESPRGDLLVVG
eukprot:746356-Hanusia_phi.AAC.3